MKSKEEVIKEKWGLDFEDAKPDENGWSTTAELHDDIDFDLFDTKPMMHEIYYTRPKSLKVIETNNGWISINSEKDLPSDSEVCHFVPCGNFDEQFMGFIKYDEVYFVDHNLQVFQDDEQDLIYLNSWLKCQITHYQPIVKPLKPIHK